ncbi:MAG: threonine/serine exporter ThrE family protein [Suipraeoptans sp.]
MNKSKSTLNNHMKIPWHDYTQNKDNSLLTESSLNEKSAIIGRTGIMLLSCGTGAWRVRSSMNSLSRTLGITCTSDIGLLAIHYTCFDGNDSITHTISLPNVGVNTAKLFKMEQFVKNFSKNCLEMTGYDLHLQLDEIQNAKGSYSPLIHGLAAAIACGAFTFLLGGGPLEMFCAFIGAGVGNYIRNQLIKHGFTLSLWVSASVASACVTYAIVIALLERFLSVSTIHEAGYICAMLFIIPGFPFITSGIDMAKLDIHSGLERLANAFIIIIIATFVGWITAIILGIQPGEFTPLGLSMITLLILRFVMSFFGVFGFSIMFNSPVPLAATAGIIGAFANTLRLSLVTLVDCPPAAAAFAGAFLAGLIASLINKFSGYPRISLTVPSIVIMVPGLYLYRAIYDFGIGSISDGSYWLISALMIVVALPFGLVFARVLTDGGFRRCD